MVASAFLAAGIGGILIACGAGDSSEPSPTTNDVTNGTSIGPAGGTVSENGVTVTIPAGALSASTPIHITESTVVPNGYTVSGKVYRFEPSGTHFSAPITIALPSSKPEIVYWTKDGSETEFEPVETDFDEAGGKASVQITHFSGGFVGTSPNGITCIVKQPNGCPGTKTTIESPSFWYVDKLYSTDLIGSKGALATDSIGINRYMNRAAGTGLLEPNADRSVWKVPADHVDAGTAQVSKGIITGFTAKAGRGGVAAGSTCPSGTGYQAPIVEYTCSGGNVYILEHPLPTPGDAGVSNDSGSVTDGGEDALSSDSGTTDANTSDATGSDDAAMSIDSSLSDANSGSDATVADAAVDSGNASDAAPTDGGSIAPAFVQTTSLDQSLAPSIPAASFVLSFANNVASGDLLVVAYGWTHPIGASVLSVQDTVGSNYVNVYKVEYSSNNSFAMWYAVAPKAGANSITINGSANPSTIYAAAGEYSGVSMLDTQHTWLSGNVPGTQLASFDSGAVATNADHELLVGAGFVNIPHIAAANPFSERFISKGKYFAFEDRIDVASGTHSAPFSVDTTGYTSNYAAAAGIAAFR